MPDPIEFVVIPSALSAAVAMAVLLLGWVPKVGTCAGGRWLGPLALAAGTLAPYRRITGATPSFPPTAAMGWIFYLTILASLVGVFMALIRLPRWTGLPTVVILFAASLGIVFINQLRDPESAATVIKVIVIAALVGGAWRWAMESAALHLERSVAPLAMLILAIFAAVLLMMSASATYGRLGFAFAGAAVPLVVVSLLRDPSPAQGTGMVLVVVLGAILCAGFYYSVVEQRWISLGLIGVAPLIMAARQAIPGLRQRGRAGFAVSLSLLIVPLVIAVVIAVPRFLKEMEADVSGYDY